VKRGKGENGAEGNGSSTSLIGDLGDGRFEQVEMGVVWMLGQEDGVVEASLRVIW
jgi:hypothetical protein